MRSLICIIVFSFCVNVALGEVIASSPDSGGLEGEGFRRGATVRKTDSSTDEWKLEIGNPADKLEGGAEPFQLGWAEPVLVFQNPTEPFADMHVFLNEHLGGFDEEFSFANFDGGDWVSGIDDFSAGQGDIDFLRYVHINDNDGPLSDMDFALQGVLYIDWSGTVSTNDAMGLSTQLSQIPEPASYLMILMVSGLGLFIRRRFKL